MCYFAVGEDHSSGLRCPAAELVRVGVPRLGLGWLWLRSRVGRGLPNRLSRRSAYADSLSLHDVWARTLLWPL